MDDSLSSSYTYEDMLNLFRRSRPDPSEIVSERWETKFAWKRRSRFEDEQTADYDASVSGRKLTLTLKRKNLFAWVNDPLYRYRDLVLEADITLDREVGYCSAGLLFRYVNESTYYYFLVSSRGYFRFDVVFNGNPIRLIDWTELPKDALSDDAEQRAGSDIQYRLRIVANGTRFTLCCNDSWIAEIDDETIDAGGIAFGAQNYDETEEIRASLERIVIDSRGLEVEANHYRWREGIPVDPEARVRLARTLFAADNPTAALIQLRKVLKARRPDAPTLFFLAECQTALGLNESALENIERTLELDPSHAQAKREKANLLYLLGRYHELNTYLAGFVREAESSVLWNLFGHAHFSLGGWEEALRGYSKACELEPEMPLFHVNAARACEHLERAQEALDHYRVAGRLLIRQDATEDLARLVPSMLALDPSSREGRIFEGTLAFQESDFSAAARLFQQLIDEGVEDTAVLYMLGLIRSREGRKRDALGLFLRATELEPGFALYWFRAAETRYILGEEPGDALDRAIELAPEDAWTLNLAGQIAIDEGRYDRAVELLRHAHESMADEIDIAINLAEAMFLSGRVEEAIALLEGRDEAVACNSLGNMYTRLGRNDEALSAYERGYLADPDDPVFAENYAAACIESDLINRAEELLGKLVDTSPSASILNRVGNLAQIEGDLTRAEAAYREAFSYLGLPDYDQSLSDEDRRRLGEDPELNDLAVDLEANLADLFLQWYRFDHARTIIQRLSAHSDAPRVGRLKQRLRSATEVGFSCATCGREWWAPKVVDVPSLVRLHGEPPHDSPAGRCERCGKVYCVGCAMEHLQGDRFVCPDCNEYLKLNNDQLKYLVLKAVEASKT